MNEFANGINYFDFSGVLSTDHGHILNTLPMLTNLFKSILNGENPDYSSLQNENPEIEINVDKNMYSFFKKERTKK